MTLHASSGSSATTYGDAVEESQRYKKSDLFRFFGNSFQISGNLFRKEEHNRLLVVS